MPSVALAGNPRASLGELAHEFFHKWNLVAIHPDTYGELRYKLTARTAGLWWGEGITLYYADALPRRADLADPNTSRLPDLRIGIDFTHATRPLRLVIRNPASVWSSSGLRTGDVLVAFNGTSPATFADLQHEQMARPLKRLLTDD